VNVQVSGAFGPRWLAFVGVLTSTRALVAIAVGALTVLAAFPADALRADAGDAGNDQGTGTLSAAPSPTPQNVLPELEGLAGKSIAEATNDPENPYTPIPVPKSFQDGSEEGNTRLTNGELVRVPPKRVEGRDRSARRGRLPTPRPPTASRAR
jgi:hypothetical protein